MPLNTSRDLKNLELNISRFKYIEKKKISRFKYIEKKKISRFQNLVSTITSNWHLEIVNLGMLILRFYARLSRDLAKIPRDAQVYLIAYLNVVFMTTNNFI